MPRLDVIDSWTAPGQVTLPGRLLAGQAVWAGGSTSEQVNTIYIRDLLKHRTSVLARAQQGWRTDWVKGDTHWVVYMEASAEATEDNPSPDWRMYVIDLRDNSRRVLATSAVAPGGAPPSPQVDGDFVVWVQPSGLGKDRDDVMAADLASPKERPSALVRGRHILDCGLSFGYVAFVDVTSRGQDLVAMNVVRPGRLIQVTNDGQVGRTNVGNGRVAFEQGPPDADPVGQYAIALPPVGTPWKVTGPVSPGSVPASNLTPGRTMLAWFTGDGTVVAPAASPMSVAVLTQTPDVQLRLDWDGDHLFWGETVTNASGLHSTLHVSTAR